MLVSTDCRPSREDVLERAARREDIAKRVLAAQAGNAPVVALGGREVDRLLVSTSIGLANLLMDGLDQELASDLEEART